uniref:Uncharacterized protein n=1 Tax=Noccaea caerulescens TaxID=107243 RepID=A0A1J3GBX0_NOCCA
MSSATSVTKMNLVSSLVSLVTSIFVKSAPIYHRKCRMSFTRSILWSFVSEKLIKNLYTSSALVVGICPQALITSVKIAKSTLICLVPSCRAFSGAGMLKKSSITATLTCLRGVDQVQTPEVLVSCVSFHSHLLQYVTVAFIVIPLFTSLALIFP